MRFAYAIVFFLSFNFLFGQIKYVDFNKKHTLLFNKKSLKVKLKSSVFKTIELPYNLSGVYSLSIDTKIFKNTINSFKVKSNGDLFISKTLFKSDKLFSAIECSYKPKGIKIKQQCKVFLRF